VEREFGPVAILINNAGVVGPFGPLWENDPTAWEQALRLNLVAPFLLTRAALPGMIAAGWGRIVNVSAGAAQHPFARTGAYSTAKAGLDMLTRQLAEELTGAGVVGVAVTALYPGLVDTAMPAHIRAQAPATIGEGLARWFQQAGADGVFQPPERPARAIAAIVATADLSFNGRIIDSDSDEGQRLASTGAAT